jgi:hypothetical protein
MEVGENDTGSIEAGLREWAKKLAKIFLEFSVAFLVY